MKKIILLVLLALVLAGCDDFPLEGGDDILRGHGHHHDDLASQHQAERADAGR